MPSFTPTHDYYISQVRLPGYNDSTSPNYQKTFYIKDSEARSWIETLASAGIKFTIAWDGESAPVVANIPLGVTVKYNNVEYTGTKVADATTAPFITLVYERTTGTLPNTRKIYGEYVTVTEDLGEGHDPRYSYWWEKIGNTDIVIDDLGELAYHDNVVLDKGNGDMVLGESTTFTNADSTVSMSYGTTQFITSYDGATSKLVKSTVRGVKTGTNSLTSASKATLSEASKAIGNADVGTQQTNIAKAADSISNVSYIGNASTSSVLQSASVSDECLSFGDVGVSQGKIWGVKTKTQSSSTVADTASFYPAVNTQSTIDVYSFSDVDVPIRNDSDSSFATGSLNNNGEGAAVMTGLGTANKESAVSTLGSGTSTATGTAAAQIITVGTGDKVKVAVYSDLGVRVTDN